MTTPLLLTFNPGSSSIKIGLFKIVSGQATRAGHGTIDLRHTPLQLQLVNNGATIDISLNSPLAEDLHEVIDETLASFAKHMSLHDLAAVGHRVVHGGDRFSGPVLVNKKTLASITELVPLAPLHQPQSVRLIRAIRHLRPGLLQVASFDTAFHRTQPDLVRRFALPRELFNAGIKRYGFHGLSYRYIASELARHFPALANGKVVVAHLGSGASLCALEAGRSKDTSMGFSTLDGVPMATRCGAIDAGVILHLLGERRLSTKEVEDLLYQRSGLLGMSGISADSRVLRADKRPEAREALDVFAFRVAGEIARLANTLGGVDTLVFTAGIGEHQPDTRAAMCDRLRWLGASIDAAANAGNARVISAADSRMNILVLPTDEEQVIADDAVSILHTQPTAP